MVGAGVAVALARLPFAGLVAPAIGIGLYQLGQTLPYMLGAVALVALFVFASSSRPLRTEPVLRDD